MKRNYFKEIFISASKEPLGKQKKLMDTVFETRRGVCEQIDDVCLIGIMI